MEENNINTNNTEISVQKNYIPFGHNFNRGRYMNKNNLQKRHYIACLNKFQRKTWDMALKLLRKFIDSNGEMVSQKQKQMLEDFELKSSRIRETIENYSLKLKELRINRFNMIHSRAEEYNGGKAEKYPDNVWRGAKIKIAREEKFLYDKKSYYIGCLLNFKRKTWDMILKELKIFKESTNFTATNEENKLISDLEMKINNIRSQIDFYCPKPRFTKKSKLHEVSMLDTNYNLQDMFSNI